jgi:hypothetical protein
LNASREIIPLIPVALDAALQLGRTGHVMELLDLVESLPPSVLPRFLRAHVSRFRGRLAAAEGDHATADLELRQAADVFRELGNPFWNAVLELERAENLAAMGRGPEANQPLNAAREIFERLGAKPWLERTDKLSSSLEGPVAAAGQNR